MSHVRRNEWPRSDSIRRLRVTYVTALALIAACLLVFAFAMFQVVPSQIDDAHIVNVSGRQRMLSQRLFKELLLMNTEQSLSVRHDYQEEIGTLLGQWTDAHRYLRGEESTEGVPSDRSDSIDYYLGMQAPYFNQMIEGYERIIAAEPDDQLALTGVINLMRLNEPPFLEYQELITDRFQYEADSRLTRLSGIAIGAFVILFLLLVIEGFLVFRPMAAQIGQSIETLTRANTKLLRATTEKNISEENLRRLLSVYPDLALVFDSSGNYTDIFTSSDHLLYRDRANLVGRNLFDVFPYEEAEYFMQAIRRTLETLQPQLFNYNLTLPVGEHTFSARTTFFDNVNGDRNVVMFVRDITREVETEKQVRRHQKRLLQTVLETQERERSRIASDMHDGIGQMFAVLKLNIAGLRREEDEEMFNDALDSIDTIVGELRSIAWNLMPASLSRFGLISTLQSETEVLEKRSGIEIAMGTAIEHERLPEQIEVCVYRIVQELMTNIIKHSGATRAEIMLVEEEGQLRLKVSDNGCGFDPDDPQLRAGGRGMVNIRSRVLAFDGSIAIDSIPGSGTTFRIELPISGEKNEQHEKGTRNGIGYTAGADQNIAGRRPQAVS